MLIRLKYLKCAKNVATAALFDPQTFRRERSAGGDIAQRRLTSIKKSHSTNGKYYLHLRSIIM